MWVGRPQTSSSPSVIFIAGRPKAALLFWFFGDFRCNALLFMVIHVIYINIYIYIPVWEIAVHLAVACDVYDVVFLCFPFSHEVSWMRS